MQQYEIAQWLFNMVSTGLCISIAFEQTNQGLSILVSAVISAATRNILNGWSTVPCCHILTTIVLYLASRNCTKHKVKCSYHDTPSQVELLRKAPSLNRQPNARSISKARPWSAEAKTVVRHWRETRSMPISDDRIGATLDPHIFSDDDLHFVYQLVKNQHRLENMGVSKLTVASSYLPTFVRPTVSFFC